MFTIHELLSVTKNISSRFPRNSEANVSEFLENHEEIFSQYSFDLESLAFGLLKILEEFWLMCYAHMVILMMLKALAVTKE